MNSVETQIIEFPWLVGLTDAGLGYSAWCGGALISDTWVLITAAHCTAGKLASDIEVFVGEHRYSNARENPLRLKISDIINHKDYDSFTTDKDFALLKLQGVPKYCIHFVFSDL